MKILVYPRDQETPYQALLYGEMSRCGVTVRYLGELTPSHTLNLLLLPAELAARRATGWRIVHLHWVFPFAIPGARRWRGSRLLAQAWFLTWLRVIRLLGLRLVWTAHNVLPHAPVFADDTAARRALIRHCDLVLAHSQSTLDELTALGAAASRSLLVPHGPLAPEASARALRAPGSGPGPRRFLFFGRVEEYKGIEDLIAAFLMLPPRTAAELTIAGGCSDPSLRARLHEMARAGGSRIQLRLEFVAEAEVTSLIGSADLVVLPFRRVTTSGSTLLALGHGRPVIIPDLPALADIPDTAAVRYDGTVPGLAAALARQATAGAADLIEMSAAARAYGARTTWHDIAVATAREVAALIGDHPRAAAGTIQQLDDNGPGEAESASVPVRT